MTIDDAKGLIGKHIRFKIKEPAGSVNEFVGRVKHVIGEFIHINDQWYWFGSNPRILDVTIQDG